MEDRSARSTAYFALALAVLPRHDAGWLDYGVSGLAIVMALYYSFSKGTLRIWWWKT